MVKLLAPPRCFCNIAAVATDKIVTDETTNTMFDAVWKSVRGDTDIQFTPAPPPKPPAEPPTWIKDVMDWLGNILSPVGEAIVSVWPWLRIVLMVLLAAGVLRLLWAILSPYWEEWRGRKPKAQDEEWRPDQTAARRLLDEADALAAKGQFEEAAHLLLYRSIEDIQKRRPELLRPSNTAREIGKFDSLPDTARSMFIVIAGHVERGIFAAVPIGEAGWNAAREAYGQFAMPDTWRKTKAAKP